MGSGHFGWRSEIRFWGELNTGSHDNDDHRFYGRRKGHALRPARRKLVETLLPEIRIARPSGGGVVGLTSLFGGEKSAYWMEIGFGGGEHLAAMAAANPDIGFIGCEPFVNGVATLLAQIEARSLTNIRIYDDDARHLLPALPDAAFQRLYLLYADPWPKKRHNRRRFVQPETVDTFARLLEDGGEFCFASDYMDYVRWVLACTADHAAFQWTAQGPADWRTRPGDSIETRYESKARLAGSHCVYLQFSRQPRN